MPIFSADGLIVSKTRTGNSFCGKRNISNIIKHNKYIKMEEGMIKWKNEKIMKNNFVVYSAIDIVF